MREADALNRDHDAYLQRREMDKVHTRDFPEPDLIRKVAENAWRGPVQATPEPPLSESVLIEAVGEALASERQAMRHEFAGEINRLRVELAELRGEMKVLREFALPARSRAKPKPTPDDKAGNA